jgi:D-aminoacyl-tRNA deacylase
MRAVVQRVVSARVVVDGVEVGAIGPGLLAFVGVGGADGPDDVAYIAGKIRDLRVFPDREGRMNRSVAEAAGAVLVVSQFTLYGDCRHGRRPAFDAAGPPGPARARYEAVADALRDAGLEVRTGAFGANMQVELVNDGPVTLLLDSARGF